jgi:hypothetical protein
MIFHQKVKGLELNKSKKKSPNIQQYTGTMIKLNELGHVKLTDNNHDNYFIRWWYYVTYRGSKSFKKIRPLQSLPQKQT